MPQALSSIQKKVKAWIKSVIKQLPKLNNQTGQRKQCTNQEQQQQLADFIYPFPNPTIVRSSDAVNISKLDPEEFELMGSKVVLLGPDVFWPGLVQIRCPLCSEVAAPNGWSDSYRRVKGLYNTYFLAGRRYKCVGCKGEPSVCCKGLQCKLGIAMPASILMIELISLRSPVYLLSSCEGAL